LAQRVPAVPALIEPLAGAGCNCGFPIESYPDKKAGKTNKSQPADITDDKWL
jgi:hypothetical protein